MHAKIEINILNDCILAVSCKKIITLGLHDLTLDPYTITMDLQAIDVAIITVNMYSISNWAHRLLQVQFKVPSMHADFLMEYQS